MIEEETYSPFPKCRLVEEGSEVPLVGNVYEGLEMIPCLLELKELNNTNAEKRKKVKEINIHSFKVAVRIFLFLFFFTILFVN